MVKRFQSFSGFHAGKWGALAVLFFLCCHALPAGQRNFRFTRISGSDGLSQNTVMCALQDSKGFMWFGTQDGLNRFDGYTFTVYKHNQSDPHSLSENWIWTIFEDSAGGLWIGTFGGGLNRFDRAAGSFRQYQADPDDPVSLSDNTVWSMAEYPRGTLWVGANNGLNRLDTQSGEFRFFKPSPNAPNAFDVRIAAPGILWVYTGDGLNEFDIRTETFTHYPFDGDDPNRQLRVRGQFVRSKSGLLHITVTTEGLVVFDLGSKATTRYSYVNEKLAKRLGSAKITNIYEDREGLLWIGTREGLFIVELKEDVASLCSELRHDPYDPYSLSHSFIFSIYENRSGQLWIGARDGLNRFDRVNQKFRHYRFNPSDPNSLSHQSVLPIIAEQRNEEVVWIGTNEGLNRLDHRSETITRYYHDPQRPQAGPGGNYIMALHEDRQGDIWIGTRGAGLSRMRMDAQERAHFTHYPHRPDDPTSVGAANIHAIYEDRRGDLWIGAGGGGLNRFNRDDETFTRYQDASGQPLPNSHVYAMLEDRQGRFWMGTASAGLAMLDRETGTFRHFRNDPDDPHSLSNNRVLCLHESPGAGGLWIGTSNGLNRLIRPADPGDEPTFMQYHESDGLPNEVIYGILEDNEGSLWVSTNKGLARIKPTEAGLQVRSYTVEDGLQSNEFSQNGFYRNSRGEMYFGGVNGFTLFHPAQVRDNPFAPPVVITEFLLFNHPVRAGAGRGSSASAPEGAARMSLKKHISLTESLQLSYRDDVFSFEFAALNFTMPAKNQYAYMMEGFDADWIYSGNRRFATYTNLDPGEYVFRVKGSNNDGLWNENGAAIRITITPPPWQTWWAYLLYGLFAAGAVMAIIRYRVHVRSREIEAQARIERARVEEREQVRKKSSADFHDEAGHILTRISLFTEIARRSVGSNTAMREYLTRIEENTKDLSAKMRDFIWVLDPQQDSLYHTLLRLKDFGNSMFQATEVRFRCHGISPEMSNCVLSLDDRRALMLIFKEAMNNCLKYSRSRKATLTVSVRSGRLVVIFNDDGMGFDPQNEKGGYGLKNMRARASRISASLDIVSAAGQGTEIRFEKDLPQMGDERPQG